MTQTTNVVYRIYEKSTGKQYIGSTELGKKYKDLNSYITNITSHTMHNRYVTNPDNYSLIIIKKFKTRELAYIYENELLTANNAHNNHSFYNRCITGSDGNIIEFSDESIAKMSKLKLGKNNPKYSGKYNYDSSIPTPSFTRYTTRLE